MQGPATACDLPAVTLIQKIIDTPGLAKDVEGRAVDKIDGNFVRHAITQRVTGIDRSP